MEHPQEGRSGLEASGLGSWVLCQGSLVSMDLGFRM